MEDREELVQGSYHFEGGPQLRQQRQILTQGKDLRDRHQLWRSEHVGLEGLHASRHTQLHELRHPQDGEIPRKIEPTNWKRPRRSIL